MAKLNKPHRVMRGNLVYLPTHIQENIGIRVGGLVQWRWECPQGSGEGRLYLEVVKNE